MPTERSNTTNNGRPLKPTLATTRTAKTPIAPRLAPSAVSANSTPTLRTTRSTIAGTPKAPSASQDDRTPVRGAINTNVTPRSSARKSRVGLSSPVSTPSATPSATLSSSRPSSTIDLTGKEQGYGYSGLGAIGLQSAQNTSRPRSIVGGSQSVATPTSRPHMTPVYNSTTASEGGGARARSPKFFHANDTRAQDAAPQPKRGPVFFYANGQQDESSRNPEMPSPPLSAIGRAQQETKFFHADSLLEPRGNSPALPSPVSSSLEPWPAGGTSQRSNSLRPPSPPKDNIHLSYRKGASQVIRPNLHTRPSALSVISVHSQEPPASEQSLRRRSSLASSVVRLGHGKSASLSSIDSATPLKKAPSTDLLSFTPSPLHSQNRVVSNGSLPGSMVSSPAFAAGTSSGLPSPSLQSPAMVLPGSSGFETVSDLAANARRERKVLDLEISNSSLLAINRQLEREVRKQKAELRRFRRMSRAGRFSLDSVASTADSFSAAGAGDIGDLSDTPEEEEQGSPADEDPEYSSESSFDEGTLSPARVAERDAAHQVRDSKRLQLDLTKHRELLIDSQKMNQSLIRCLSWTEDLIKEGQKALAYQVRPSDVKLGGRVLTTEEHSEAEEDDESKALLSPWSPAQRNAAGPLARSSWTGSERTDRDSGVEIDGPAPMAPEFPDDVSPFGSPLGKVLST